MAKQNQALQCTAGEAIFKSRFREISLPLCVSGLKFQHPDFSPTIDLAGQWTGADSFNCEQADWKAGGSRASKRTVTICDITTSFARKNGWHRYQKPSREQLARVANSNGSPSGYMTHFWVGFSVGSPVDRPKSQASRETPIAPN